MFNIFTADWIRYFMYKLPLYICVVICVVQNVFEKLQIYWTLKK